MVVMQAEYLLQHWYRFVDGRCHVVQGRKMAQAQTFATALLTVSFPTWSVTTLDWALVDV
jgi:hypothetical protein